MKGRHSTSECDITFNGKSVRCDFHELPTVITKPTVIMKPTVITKPTVIMKPTVIRILLQTLIKIALYKMQRTVMSSFDEIAAVEESKQLREKKLAKEIFVATSRPQQALKY